MRGTKKMVLGILGALVVLIAYKALHQPKVEMGAVEVGNKTCPVSGNPVDGVSHYTHDGKQYSLCSPACAAPLAQNPEQYTKEKE